MNEQAIYKTATGKSSILHHYEDCLNKCLSIEADEFNLKEIV